MSLYRVLSEQRVDEGLLLKPVAEVSHSKGDLVSREFSALRYENNLCDVDESARAGYEPVTIQRVESPSCPAETEVIGNTRRE